MVTARAVSKSKWNKITLIPLWPGRLQETQTHMKTTWKAPVDKTWTDEVCSPAAREASPTLWSGGHNTGKPQVPWNAKIQTQGHFLCPYENFCQKRSYARFNQEGTALQAHVNLQIQAINPTHICPSNGRVRMNSTRTPSPAGLKHEVKERKWILKLTTHLWFTNIYTGHKARTKQTWQTLT